MRYVEAQTLDPGVGSMAVLNYSANDAQDPYQGVGGHQPLGWDQWSAFYNHYVVVGARIKVQFSNESWSTGNSQVMCGINLSDDLTISSSPTALAEQNLTKYKLLRVGSNQNQVVAYKNYSARKFFNITDIKDNFDRLGALVSTGPTEKAYFNVFAGSIIGSDDAPQINILVTIDYIVDFSEPKEVTQS